MIAATLPGSTSISRNCVSTRKVAVNVRRVQPTGSRHPRRFAVAATPEDETDPVQGGKAIDSAGAGRSFQSPAWLTQLNMLWSGKGNIPVADAKPDDIKDLLGGALFKALFKWMTESGPVYLLPTGPASSFLVISDPAAAKHVLCGSDNSTRNLYTGPASSFLVISDPAAAKHVLRGSDNTTRNLYNKGLVAEVSTFLFGDGFAITGGDAWRARRKAVAPSLHKTYLGAMLDRVFVPTSQFACEKLKAAEESGKPVNIEAIFSQLTLDIIGKSVFNYDFDSLTKDSPLIQAVYTALKETETRATDVIPLWKIPIMKYFDPRQRKAAEAVEIIQKTTSDLIRKCKAMVDDEEMEAASAAAEAGVEYINDSDPSVLRFLIAAREEVDSTQLRDDLLSMLVAGHETTGSVLTWTMYLLSQNPEKMAKAQEEVDRILGDRMAPVLADYGQLKYVMRCVNESMRLYPHPPVLLRRALVADVLPGGYNVNVGQDVMISVYNIHHSPAVWEDAEAFKPERFGPLDGPVPNEQNTDYKFIPFSGGPRKCVGDQFALMEAVIAMTVLLKQYDFELAPNQTIEMTTGATIHTTNGLYMNVKSRTGQRPLLPFLLDHMEANFVK
eukprot:gene30409-35414_t